MARHTEEAVICPLSPVPLEGVVEIAACNVHVPQALTLLRVHEGGWRAWGAQQSGATWDLGGSAV